MKYNGFYFWMFKHPMKKVLAEKYGAPYAAEIMKKSRPESSTTAPGTKAAISYQ